ncbi:MAG: leucyl aminopeptidase family protein, partial [Paracoccus sp. (in: a-proteobacteria)]|nr:leucyl aminopeptidase family protein [Paracoccus sp. (in: a-proteobacteria)]
MSPRFADKTQPSLPLWLAACALPEGLPDGAREWAEACGFTGAAGQVCLLPGEDGLAGAIYGIGPEDRLARDPFAPAAAGAALPEGIWRLAGGPAGVDRFAFALGWLLTAYRFDKYKKSEAKRARLVAPDGLDAARIEIMAEAEFLTRDLINTPANDLGPAALEDAARELAGDCGMAVKVIAGDDLLDQNFPLIHTVGRAGRDAPRLIELTCGTEGPSLTLVGKGVCFDTGGLNIKPGASMGLMKKDMGGAASVLGLTQMLARTGAAKGMRLRVLIPAVE